MGTGLDLHFVDNSNYLRRKFLEEGLVYVFKDGRVALYLGIASGSGKFVFYRFFELSTGSDGQLLHGEYMHNNIVRMVNELMSIQFNPQALSEYKSMPSIIREYPCLDFRSVYMGWYAKACMFNKMLPVIMARGKKQSSAQLGYVGVKDLIVGRVYDSSMDSYMYLGRGTGESRKFYWMYIGVPPQDFINDAKSYISNWMTYFLTDAFFSTVSNKKVKQSEVYGDTVYLSSSEAESIIKRVQCYL